MAYTPKAVALKSAGMMRGKKGLLNSLGEPHEEPVHRKEHPDGGNALGTGKTGIDKSKQDKSKENEPLPAEPVGRHARGNAREGIDQVEHKVDRRDHGRGDADLARPQDQEDIARIAEGKEGRDPDEELHLPVKVLEGHPRPRDGRGGLLFSLIKRKMTRTANTAGTMESQKTFR